MKFRPTQGKWVSGHYGYRLSHHGACEATSSVSFVLNIISLVLFVTADRRLRFKQDRHVTPGQ